VAAHLLDQAAQDVVVHRQLADLALGVRQLATSINRGPFFRPSPPS
jgi:hypothetical protein